MAGLPEAITFLEELRDEIKYRVENKIGVVPQERHRIIMPFVPPFWDMSIMNWMEEQYGAVTVITLLDSWRDKGEWLIEPSKPLENIARKTFLIPGAYQGHGPMEEYLEDSIRNARDYQADGAIFFAHIGCRHGCALNRSIKDELQDKLGIPMVTVDCDLVDKSFTTPDEVREKLDGFFEILEK
jgi:benzoyl-CoA reductase/2-hydroxyglutaryl-CoA dehydratase subunit BcrC/BadD/HgdB